MEKPYTLKTIAAVDKQTLVSLLNARLGNLKQTVHSLVSEKSTPDASLVKAANNITAILEHLEISGADTEVVYISYLDSFKTRCPYTLDFLKSCDSRVFGKLVVCVAQDIPFVDGNLMPSEDHTSLVACVSDKERTLHAYVSQYKDGMSVMYAESVIKANGNTKVYKPFADVMRTSFDYCKEVADKYNSMEDVAYLDICKCGRVIALKKALCEDYKAKGYTLPKRCFQCHKAKQSGAVTKSETSAADEVSE